MVSTPSKPASAVLSSKRIFSIDVFRALTMLTMIFVNDFGTLSGIPGWLEHSQADQDFLGFSDVVFPCFLVIVGMSIPFAIRQRLDKGDSYVQILTHIALRSIALLVMGVFFVNIHDLNEKATGLSADRFVIIMIMAFFLIWNQYPKREDITKLAFIGIILLSINSWVIVVVIIAFFLIWNEYLKRDDITKLAFIGLRLLGIGTLIYLAVSFRAGNDGHLTRLTPQWWGILGLIGWTYLTCATLYLFLHKQPVLLIISWLFFTLLNIAGHAGWLHAVWPTGPRTWIPDNGAFNSLAFAGILATLLLTRWQQTNKANQLPILFTGIGFVFLAAGLLARNFFIISKIQATPTWIFLCCGIAFIVYAGIYWLVDLNSKLHWFDLIKTAGTSTLTCYLIPDLYYSIANLSGISLPESVTTGGIGLLKSLLFALLIIGITAVLGKLRIKLKL